MKGVTSPADMAWEMMPPNLTYLAVGCLILMVVLPLGWKAIDRMTPFDIGIELQKKNMAVALLLSAMALGVCGTIGMVVSAAIG